MIEQQKQRIEQEITKLVDDVDKSFLRKMQASVSGFNYPLICVIKSLSGLP